MRFFGKVGYVETKETDPINHPGVFNEVITERSYRGDVTRDTRNLEGASVLNDNFTISNQFSIVADDYAYIHLRYIRYVEYLGVKWEVTSVDPLYRPRLILTVRGIYNSPEEG